jgi:hypothetical protein
VVTIDIVGTFLDDETLRTNGSVWPAAEEKCSRAVGQWTGWRDRSAGTT